MRLALIHRPRAAMRPSAPPIAWRTCLREVQFVDESSGPPPSEPVLQDADAYALLLEIVCGLRSPVIGESEVQAQFKAFVARLDPAIHGWLRRLGERVLADAKGIRHRYLQGFGAHSYGRLAASHVLGERAAIIGTGALARQVLDHVPGQLAVDIWGRRLEALAGGSSRILRQFLIAGAATAAPESGPTTLVIAAPIGEDDLNTVVLHYHRVIRSVDLRAADQQTPIDPRIPVVTLSRLLTEASIAGPLAGASVPAAAVAEVRRRARAFAGREELRPFGWDDLCA